MTSLVACVVCARPLGALLTHGLEAGVAVLAGVALTVLAALVWGAITVVRQDRIATTDAPCADAPAIAGS